MAAQKVEKKRKKKRKARTEVSSPSSSDIESPQNQQPEQPQENQIQPALQTSTDFRTSPDAEAARLQEAPEESTLTAPSEPVKLPDEAFSDFYLQKATKEFANDLDKLRSAPDFKVSSVPILIGALRQGTACFSKVERERIGASGQVVEST